MSPAASTRPSSQWDTICDHCGSECVARYCEDEKKWYWLCRGFQGYGIQGDQGCGFQGWDGPTTFAAPVTPAAGRASSSDEPELTGSATASEAVFARIRHAEASGRVIDLAADDDAAPAPKRVKTEKDYYAPSDIDSFDHLGDVGECVSSAYGMYKKDDPDSELVQSAAAGDIANVRLLVEKTTGTFLLERAQLVNAARRWTEVQEKWGYDKSWEWYGDTALIAAARRGHAEVVRYLLDKALADPTLESCVTDDHFESAAKACEIGKQTCELRLATLANSVFTEHSQRQYEQNCDRLVVFTVFNSLEELAAPQRRRRELRGRPERARSQAGAVRTTHSDTRFRATSEKKNCAPCSKNKYATRTLARAALRADAGCARPRKDKIEEGLSRSI